MIRVKSNLTEAFETCQWNPQNWLVHFLPNNCRSLQSDVRHSQRRSAAKKFNRLFLIFYIWTTTKLGFDFFFSKARKRDTYLTFLRQGCCTLFSQVEDVVEVAASWVGPGNTWMRTDESQVDQQSDGWRQQERPHLHHCHSSSQKLF